MPIKVDTNELCDWECGRQAEYFFPYSKKYCCGHNVSKCPAKNKKMVKTRKDNNSYKTGAQKGLETKKNTILPNGLTVLEQSGKNMSKTITTPNKNGNTIADLRAKKMVETRRNTIDPSTGLNLCQLVGLKSSNTKLNIIDPETGLNMNQISARRGIETKLKIDDSGLNWFDRVKESVIKKTTENGKKIHKERLADIDKDGLDYYARRTKKLLEDIDENGLNGIERAHKNRIKSGIKKKYLDTELYYQCSYEFNFLDNLRCRHGIDWLKNNVSNGLYFKYYHPINNAYRYYIADFFIGNTIYEIKSSYTWNKHGEDNDLELINEAKLKSVKQQGYSVILVLNGEEIIK